MTFGSLSHGFSQQDLPHQSFEGHSGYLAELTWLCSLNSKKCFDLQGSANFTAAQFVAKCHISGVAGAAQCAGGITGGRTPKSPSNVASFFFNAVYSQNILSSNMEAPNLFLAAGAI